MTADLRLSVNGGNRLKLGLFGPNCSSGLAITTAPERWPAEWHETAEMVRLADERGIDFILPVARWKGYGGVTDYEGTSFESIAWAVALLALTSRITVFATVHTPLFHPVIAAKQMVTADHVGKGRFALNIVAGWNEGEFEMFGVAQRDHEKRYEHAQEWIDAISRMWTTDDFDFIGKHLQLRGLRLKPKPYGGTRPFLVNAGRSPAGRAFALRNCDAIFTGVRASAFDETTGVATPDLATVSADVQDITSRSHEFGRSIGVFARAEIVCRPTQREAFEYYRYAFEEHADVSCLANDLIMHGLTREADPEAFAVEVRKRIRRMPIVGDPDTVARLLAEISLAGCSAIAVSFINYARELPFFCDEVLPRLERVGLRARGELPA